MFTVPKKGLVVWKKAALFTVPTGYTLGTLSPPLIRYFVRHVLVKLLITAGAKHNINEMMELYVTYASPSDRLPRGRVKCRASEAKVLGFFDLRGKPLRLKKDQTVRSLYSDVFEYKKGAVVRPDGCFSPHLSMQCAEGIHFYLSRRGAERHHQ